MKNIKEIIIGLLIVAVAVMALQINKLNTELKATKAKVSAASSQYSVIPENAKNQIYANKKSGILKTPEQLASEAQALVPGLKSSTPTFLKPQSAEAASVICIMLAKGFLNSADGSAQEDAYFNALDAFGCW